MLLQSAEQYAWCLEKLHGGEYIVVHYVTGIVVAVLLLCVGYATGVYFGRKEGRREERRAARAYEERARGR